MRNGHYLKHARLFVSAASRELEAARKSRDDTGIRQSAEKGWGAVVQAANALLASRGLKPGVGTGRKQDLLQSLEERDRRARALALSSRYADALLQLHARCFYDGDFSLDGVERGIRRAGKFVEDVARIV
jgi:hypothetical protein